MAWISRLERRMRRGRVIPVESNEAAGEDRSGRRVGWASPAGEASLIAGPQKPGTGAPASAPAFAWKQAFFRKGMVDERDFWTNFASWRPRRGRGEFASWRAHSSPLGDRLLTGCGCVRIR